MKFKTLAKRLLNKHEWVLMHDVVEDQDQNLIPVMFYPKIVLPCLWNNFLLGHPRSGEDDWHAYVLYMCVPRVKELIELYRRERGDDAGSDWLEDLYDKIVNINPLLKYEALLMYQQTPQNKDNVVYGHFGIVSEKKVGQRN
jgi:hypothetical protein